MVQLVGILNVTPDSFSDGGKFYTPQDALKQAEKLFNDGADLVDVGAESTRPGAKKLTDTEEWDRLELILPGLITKLPGRISFDSHHPANIQKALKIGPVIVNDVTGLNDPEIIKLVIKLRPHIIISHLPNMPLQTAHQLAPVSTIKQVKQELLEKVNKLEANGVLRDHIILDPGIGFGKTMELNRKLLKFAEEVPGFSVMIGYSKKRFLGEQRFELEPNLVAAKIAIESGADYLRVHDVKSHRNFLEEKY